MCKYTWYQSYMCMDPRGFERGHQGGVGSIRSSVYLPIFANNAFFIPIPIGEMSDFRILHGCQPPPNPLYPCMLYVQMGKHFYIQRI